MRVLCGRVPTLIVRIANNICRVLAMVMQPNSVLGAIADFSLFHLLSVDVDLDNLAIE